MPGLKRLTVRGFKSIRALEDFELRDLNVLIGANGAGKSNFISLFQMLAALMDRRLQLYVQEHDGPDALLFGTRKRTRRLNVDLYFGEYSYHIGLLPTGRQLVFAPERTFWSAPSGTYDKTLGSGYDETRLPDEEDDNPVLSVRHAIAGWRVYHFHDTSSSALMRQALSLRDNLRLKPDASNIHCGHGGTRGCSSAPMP